MENIKITELLPTTDLNKSESISNYLTQIEEAKKALILAAAGKYTADDPEFAIKPLADLTVLQDDLKNLQLDIEGFEDMEKE